MTVGGCASIRILEAAAVFCLSSRRSNPQIPRSICVRLRRRRLRRRRHALFADADRNAATWRIIISTNENGPMSIAAVCTELRSKRWAWPLHRALRRRLCYKLSPASWNQLRRYSLRGGRLVRMTANATATATAAVASTSEDDEFKWITCWRRQRSLHAKGGHTRALLRPYKQIADNTRGEQGPWLADVVSTCAALIISVDQVSNRYDVWIKTLRRAVSPCHNFWLPFAAAKKLATDMPQFGRRKGKLMLLQRASECAIGEFASNWRV